MPLSRVSKVFAVKDAKVRKMTADPAGGAATYGTTIDVPGIKSVTIGGDVSTAELRGDNTRLDFQAIIGGISLTFEWAKADLDLLQALLGGTVAEAGTTPNQTSTLGLTGDNASPGYFDFRAVSVSGDTIGGDVLLTLHKCVISSFPELGMAEEDYKTFSVEAAALPRLSDKKWMDVVYRETAVALT